MPILPYLERSGATEAFREALARFLRTGQPCERIVFEAHCPSVKVQRTLTKVLEEYPALPIESIELRAHSGCEYFRGTAHVHTADGVRAVRFHWDCKWKAEQMGWTDWFGLADQVRAAQEFGHDCFRTWEEVGVVQAAPA